MSDHELFYKDGNQSDTGSDRQEEPMNEQIAMNVDPSSPARTVAGPTGAFTNAAIAHDANKLVKGILLEISKMAPTTRKYEAAELRAMVDFSTQVDGLTIESLGLTEQITTMIADKPEQRRTPLYQNAIRALMHERENRDVFRLREDEALLTQVHNGTGVSIQNLRDAVAASGAGEIRCPKGAPMGPQSGNSIRRASATSGMTSGQDGAALLGYSRPSASPSLGRRPSTSNECPGYPQQRFNQGSQSQKLGNIPGHSYQRGSATGVDEDVDMGQDEHPRPQNSGFRGRRDGDGFSQPGGVRKRANNESSDLEELAMRQLMSGHFVDADGSLPKRPRSNRGEDHGVDSASGRRGSAQGEGGARRYDDEGYAQPVGRGGPPQGGMRRYAGDGYALHAQPRGDRGYPCHLDAPRDETGGGRYDRYDDGRRQRGRQLDHFPQDLSFVEPYVAQPYVEDDMNYNGRSQRGGMSQGRNQYQPNRPRGDLRSRSRSPLPRHTERHKSRSFAQDDQEYYENVAFPGQLPAGGPRVRGAPHDECGLMRHQGYGPYNGRGFRPVDEPLHPQQRDLSRHPESQRGATSGFGRALNNDEYLSSPPALAMCPLESQSRPRPTPSTSSTTNATVNKSETERDESEQPRQADRRQSRPANIDVEYIAMLMEDEEAERQRAANANANGQQQITDADFAAAVARHGLTRAQDWGNPNDDRALRMAVVLRDEIGNELKERNVSANTTCLERVSPLAMTQARFDALSDDEKKKLCRQRIQRENLYIRACEMVMGVAGGEECMRDIGPHSIINKTNYASARLSGNSSGVTNPDNIFAVLEYEMFNATFQQVAIS